ncbi:MAG: hypothetical protein A2Z91_08155 [Deltaproteobacteria bacterium GWA2_38_16]|nr:MAG: hypothetical protein A2Z91_08155 [Deltaproteobacteria bacterium GWA2_38_16]OGQ01879.1 MAG: hypothetical protein A3D19_03165 [Deltaproteobacteria bacterium RIFCSPHIGHO2_02_FULL_38_15]OGQ29938.1 MAG: hypothetical protein A3A72_05835 [Deltaproteobacteria bacterium RIFCSPLOWO2_01_FULL_38_9]OGQ60017.1 MAG: hypothetical protein A3G92_04360 [Deltaproteobacteria bacterium RIFCSPLOWO2_12_FULL_38_8]HBQ20765.1 hypothetical protein [Deltaproteobacteria bacterium]
MKKKKRNYSNANEYLEVLKEEIKGVNIEVLEKQIDEEFAQGDFSSLGPEPFSPTLFEAIERDKKKLEELRQEKQKPKKFSSKRKYSEKSVLV